MTWGEFCFEEETRDGHSDCDCPDGYLLFEEPDFTQIPYGNALFSGITRENIWEEMWKTAYSNGELFAAIDAADRYYDQHEEEIIIFVLQNKEEEQK